MPYSTSVNFSNQGYHERQLLKCHALSHASSLHVFLARQPTSKRSNLPLQIRLPDRDEGRDNKLVIVGGTAEARSHLAVVRYKGLQCGAAVDPLLGR